MQYFNNIKKELEDLKIISEKDDEEIINNLDLQNEGMNYLFLFFLQKIL